MSKSRTGDPVAVGILGCGNVGGSLARMLLEDAAGVAERSGVRFELAGVAVADPTRERAGIPAGLITGDAMGLVRDRSVEVVVELIGGIDTALELVSAALAAGKPVVTANKALLAEHGRGLEALARASGVDLLYEAAVAGAIPLVRPLRESLAGESIHRVTGIVNGTTNFVLTMMSELGSSYEEALTEAKRLGMAEADPTADVEGFDAAAKAAILAGLAFHCDVKAADVQREGIASVRPLDIEFARRLGYVVKLLAVAERVDRPVPKAHMPAGAAPGEQATASAGAAPGEQATASAGEISVRVHPAMVPASHPLASVRGPFNAVFVEGAGCGDLMFYGQGAGGLPTASAVLGDLVDAAHHLRSAGASYIPERSPAVIHPPEDLWSAWYLSIDVVDRPGVLAAVATVFGDHGISIRSMEQVGLADEARLVFLTHMARQGSFMGTLEALKGIDAVEQIGGALRVLGDVP